MTVVTPDGATHVVTDRPAPRPPIDCFYVYPTVSQSSGVNAPLRSAPEIVATVRAQAALFATECRLFVPLYRQVTVAALTSGRFADPHANAIALADLRAAWHDYLAHDNDGRGVVLIGHSQGAMQLTKLIRSDIDGDATTRARLVSAILLGGNVTVPAGKTAGGDFSHIPTCTSAGEFGCLVAYSSFATTPPLISFFGRAAPGQQVVCVDPAALLGRRHISPIVPTRATAGAILSGNLPAAARFSTGYVSFPGALRARCVDSASAHVLHVSGRVNGRPVSTLQTLGSAWGLHIADVNLELGDLLALVSRESSAWAAAHPVHR
jgi:hypothetical protein